MLVRTNRFRIFPLSKQLFMFSSASSFSEDIAMNDDLSLVKILTETKLIAMVGASPTHDRPSYEVMEYLQSKGFRVLPVNPVAAGRGENILGEAVYASIDDIPEKLRSTIDMVDIFRKPADVGGIVDDVIRVGGIKTIWMQLGIVEPLSATRARKAGINVIMDRCPKIEYGKLIESAK